MSIKLQPPLKTGVRTDGYGWRGAVYGAAGQLIVGPRLHTGQDWSAPKGTPVYAAHSGRVTRIWWDHENGVAMGGNMLQLSAAQLATRYAHLDRYAVSLGDEVSAGQLIGYVGDTGAATGPHLHFELLLGGVYADPMPYITSTPTPDPIIERKSRMHAIQQIGLPDSGVIIGGGQPPRARAESVFIAECHALGITPAVVPDWIYGTAVREAWTDFNTAAELIAATVAGKIPAQSSTSPLGLSDDDAQRIAQAVNDMAADRLRS